MPPFPGLFGPAVPDGFSYRGDFVSSVEERDLVAAISRLNFSTVVMRGGIARRRTAHFGVTYGYDARRTAPGDALPRFLLPLRERCAAWLGVESAALEEALVTEYPAGAAIGWHRDAPMFGDISGVSLLTSSRMKFRPYVSPKDIKSASVRRTTHEVVLEPRSAYVLTRAARRDFEHSIPPVASLRYSITFRTLRRR
jgi:DNA oxidative demethylase